MPYMQLPFKDVQGDLYTARGLRLGGYPTIIFLRDTAPLEVERPGVREEIIAESHYTIVWLTYCIPELCFYLALLAFHYSIVAAAIGFAVGYVYGVCRFFLFGTSRSFAYLSIFWSWLRHVMPAGVIYATWQQDAVLVGAIMFFWLAQGFLGIFTAIFLRIRAALMGGVFRKRIVDRLDVSNLEGLAVSFAIQRWWPKLLNLPPPESLGRL